MYIIYLSNKPILLESLVSTGTTNVQGTFEQGKNI